MASPKVEAALKRAAESIAERSITDYELQRIVEAFESTAGSTYDRAIRGIASGISANEEVVRSKAASDNTDRLIDDLVMMVKGS